MALVAVISASSVMAHGQPGNSPASAPRIEKRIVNQKSRIAHKLAKGKITQDQANKLNQDVDAVQSKEQGMAKDGKLTKEERKDLRQDLKKTEQEIKSTGGNKASS